MIAGGPYYSTLATQCARRPALSAAGVLRINAMAEYFQAVGNAFHDT